MSQEARFEVSVAAQAYPGTPQVDLTAVNYFVPTEVEFTILDAAHREKISVDGTNDWDELNASYGTGAKVIPTSKQKFWLKNTGAGTYTVVVIARKYP